MNGLTPKPKAAPIHVFRTAELVDLDHEDLTVESRDELQRVKVPVEEGTERHRFGNRAGPTEVLPSPFSREDHHAPSKRPRHKNNEEWEEHCMLLNARSLSTSCMGASEGRGQDKSNPVELLGSDGEDDDATHHPAQVVAFTAGRLPSKSSFHTQQVGGQGQALSRSEGPGTSMYVRSKKAWIGTFQADNLFLAICNSPREIRIDARGVGPWGETRSIKCCIAQRHIDKCMLKYTKFTGWDVDDGTPGLLAFELVTNFPIGDFPQLEKYLNLENASERRVSIELEPTVAAAKAAWMNGSVNWRSKWSRLNPKRADQLTIINDIFSQPWSEERNLLLQPLPEWWHLDSSFAGTLVFPHHQDTDSVTVTYDDTVRLQPGEFLNDTLIDMYLKYLEQSLPQATRSRVHFFNSFFFKKLQPDPQIVSEEPYRIRHVEQNNSKDNARDWNSTVSFPTDHAALHYAGAMSIHERVMRWTKRFDLFDKDFLFIPIHSDLHWSLVVICHPGVAPLSTAEATIRQSTRPRAQTTQPDPTERRLCILHMNSLAGTHTNLNMEPALRAWLMGEWAIHQQLAYNEWSKACNRFAVRGAPFMKVAVPQQQNASDCGLFVLHEIECFCQHASGVTRGERWFQPEEASKKRSMMKRLIHGLAEEAHERAAFVPNFKV